MNIQKEGNFMNYNGIENENKNASEDIINVIDLVEDKNSIIHNIIKTDNIELYDKLTLEEKTNFKIVKYLITKYCFNREFTLKVVKNYIDHKRYNIEDNEYIEILILINKFKSYLDGIRAEEDELKLKLDMFYNTLWKYAENRVEEEFNDKNLTKRYFGIGYRYINDKYLKYLKIEMQWKDIFMIHMRQKKYFLKYHYLGLLLIILMI